MSKNPMPLTHMVEAALALGLDAAFGYPRALQQRTGHPVEWIGALITALDRRFNRETDGPPRRRLNGVLAMLATAGSGAAFGWVLQAACGCSRFSPLLRAVAAVPGLAQRSLLEHVEAVAEPLRKERLGAARTAVGRIVGRDVDHLDEAGVALAVIESLAESFNDGVVAPAFWLAVGGLPALYAYKALNTADSLIGHRETRWRAFGWASARADDLVNLIPARIAGALIALAGGGGWRTMLRDAPRHASPNAGWPEAAMAGALGVQLGGAVAYDGVMTERSVFNAGSADPGTNDLNRALAVYGRASLLLGAGFLVYGMVRRRAR